MATQSECRQAYIETLRKLVDELDAIDKATPAEPQTEPVWWIGMMNLQKAVQVQLWSFAPQDKPVKREAN